MTGPPASTPTPPCRWIPPLTLPGWQQDISGARTLEDLPSNARSYVQFLEDISGTRISAIGVGQDRDATIAVHDLID